MFVYRILRLQLVALAIGLEEVSHGECTAIEE
jgi:hypothetical protein